MTMCMAAVTASRETASAATGLQWGICPHCCLVWSHSIPCRWRLVFMHRSARRCCFAYFCIMYFYIIYLHILYSEQTPGRSLVAKLTFEPHCGPFAQLCKFPFLFPRTRTWFLHCWLGIVTPFMDHHFSGLKLERGANSVFFFCPLQNEAKLFFLRPTQEMKNCLKRCERLGLPPAFPRSCLQPPTWCSGGRVKDLPILLIF